MFLLHIEVYENLQTNILSRLQFIFNKHGS